MRTISAMDLRRRMGELLDQASAGERIVVERDRRPLAVLVPYEDAIRLEESPAEARARALAALDRLKAFAGRFPPDSEPAALAVRLERDRGHETAG
ncbi:MAG TPA: type II toxin-antitoxin system prevent-host-death family antitoxin [Candidatus Limnocylindria bacterium]